MSSKIDSVKPTPKQSASSSKIIQNYSKMLQNFVSRPQSTTRHQRTNSDYMRIDSKIMQNQSGYNPYAVSAEKKQAYSSR